MGEITRILSAIDRGDPQAADQLLPQVYEELRRLAAHKLAQAKPGQTLDATALVHEAYLRLVASERPGSPTPWNGRGHFFGAAAQAMRRILVEAARRKKRHKHGGMLRRSELTDASAPSPDERLLELHEALLQLAKEDAEAARVLELHHFAGLGHDEVAAALGITVYRARQKWTYARAWLSDALESS
jgi:RNA polymerase sigma factor (TIGR02999 family)